MRRSVDLYDHTRLKAGEVGNEAAENNLTTKSEVSDLLPPKPLPQTVLGTCGIASKAPRYVPQTVRHGATPHPGPPPQGGRES
jgi:hypothetical protein